MKYAAAVLIFAALLAPLEASAQEGILYFDRGHYWIELTFRGSGGGRVLPPDLSKRDFAIMEPGGGEAARFAPSRIEADSLRKVVILSSGRLKGRKCYRVIYREESPGRVLFDSVCDPFYFEPSCCGPKDFFSSYIAPAFSSSGRTYRISRLSAAYEMSENRTDTEIYINPNFEFGGWSICPALEWDRASYRRSGIITGRRVAGLEGSYSRWFRELRYRFSVSYQHQFLSNTTDLPTYSHYLSTAVSVRLDHFFDRANRFCYSVFKGADLKFGYAWYQSNREEVWGSSDFGHTVPFMEGRITWTVLYGLQFSYSILSAFPSQMNDNFEEFHRFRLRLMLRGLLEPPSRKGYHPDLLLAYDTGRRFPLFEDEKKISLGFVFDLFPW